MILIRLVLLIQRPLFFPLQFTRYLSLIIPHPQLCSPAPRLLHMDGLYDFIIYVSVRPSLLTYFLLASLPYKAFHKMNHDITQSDHKTLYACTIL